MGLEEQLTDCLTRLQEGRFANKQSISQGVVLPILNGLGWPVFDTGVVSPEYATGAGRADFALCDPPSQPKCFIDVKQPGKDGDAVRQALECAFHTGVQFVVLTDGVTWSFYLPAEPGEYEDRRVFKLDLTEHDASASGDTLRRYLLRERVASGAFLEDARKEYQDRNRRKVARKAIPAAWNDLVSGRDELIVDWVAETVESDTGVRPDEDDVVAFLRALAPAGPEARPTGTTARHPPGPNPGASPDILQRGRRSTGRPMRRELVFRGERIDCGNAMQALVAVLENWR